MKNKRWMVAAAALAVAVPAHAEIFKCKGADGKTVISDTRCENEAPKAAPKAPEKDPSARYQPTDADRVRIKALEAIVDNKASNSEQKSAAQWELGNIRRGADVTLKPEDREKRDALVAQLATADQKKRTELLAKIRTYYDK